MKQIILWFNKRHLTDTSCPPWALKYNGSTHNVYHVEVEPGVRCSTRETPNDNITKGSMEFRGEVKLVVVDNQLMAIIY